MIEPEIICRSQTSIEVELTPDNIYSADLEAGYHVEAVKLIDEDGIISRVKYTLSKDGKPVYSFSAEQAGCKERQPDMIMKEIKAYLVEEEGMSAADWIEKLYLKSPEDIPPWERKQPVRKIGFETASAVTIDISIKNLIDEFTLNDSGNARRFIEESRGWLVYDKSSCEWFAWVNNHWEPAAEKLQQTELFVAASLKTELEYFKELSVRFAENDSVDKLLKRYIANLSRHIDSSLNAPRLEAMSKRARAYLSVDLQKESNIHLLAFKNGVIDTSSGKIYEMWDCAALKEQYPTIYIERVYKPGSKAPLFNEHLRLLFTDNTSEDITIRDQIDRAVDTDIYVRRLFGYLLTAGNPEQIIVFWYGQGSNGKSTTINLLRDVLGEQVAEASCKELYTSREEKPASGISQGLGCRVMIFSEMGSEEDNTKCTRYNKDAVKTLTGETATSWFRDLYQKSKTKQVICKPIALTNSFPEFNSVDEGLLRRIVTIPFLHKFSGENRDKSMEEKLRSEADEIFTLMIDELKKYCSEGFPKIPDYCQETKNQLLSGGIYSEFAQSEFCLSTDKGEVNKIKGTALQDRFKMWCEEKDVEVKTKAVKKRDDRIDAYGQKYEEVITVIALADSEVRKLYKAFRIRYGSVFIRGVEYFNCKPLSH